MMQTFDKLSVKKGAGRSEKLIPVSHTPSKVPQNSTQTAKESEKSVSPHKAAMMRIRSLHRSQTKVLAPH